MTTPGCTRSRRSGASAVAALTTVIWAVASWAVSGLAAAPNPLTPTPNYPTPPAPHEKSPTFLGPPIHVDLSTARFKVPAEEGPLFGYDQQQKRLFFQTGGPVELHVDIPEYGDYLLTVRASCEASASTRLVFRVVLESTATAELLVTEDVEREYKIRPTFWPGSKRFYIEFVTTASNANQPGSTLYIHSVTLRKLPTKSKR